MSMQSEFTNVTDLRKHYAAVQARLKPRRVVKITESDLLEPVPVKAKIVKPAFIVVRPYLVHHEFPTMNDIGDEVCHFYEVTKVEFVSHRRDWPTVKARQVAMFLARQMTPFSYPRVAKWLGGRDHTTVIHGARKIAKLEKENQRMRDELDILRLRINDRLQRRQPQ